MVIGSNQEKLSKKVALVTGSSRGIGRAIAIALAKKGITVVVNNKEHIDEGSRVVHEIQSIGCDAIYIQADVADPSQVETIVEHIIAKFDRIDIVVNNAGIIIDRLLENMDINDWNKVLSVNLTGMFNCTKAAVPYMKRQGGGKIINIASLVGEIGNIGQANYAASKGGVIAFTKTLAKEYARYNILVNAIAPGFIETAMLKSVPEKVMRNIVSQIPLGRLGKPEEVAALVCFLVSDDAQYITGQIININGGLYM